MEYSQLQQELSSLRSIIEGQNQQINQQIKTISVQMASLATSLEHSTAETRRCMDHYDERIADHEARLRGVEKDSPWMREIEKIQAQLDGIYASINELEEFRDRGIGGKEYLAYLIGVVGGFVGIYAVFFKLGIA